MQKTADRLIKALQANPELAWNVLTQLKVVSPWVETSHGMEFWWVRETPNNWICGTIRLERDGWVFSYFPPNENLPMEETGFLSTLEEAFVAGDAILRKYDWILRS